MTLGPLLLGLLAAAALAVEPSSGVVVETLVAGGAAGRAGLRPGDVLLSWSRAAHAPANPAPAGGRLRSPLDAEQVEVEQAPRGPVTLSGLRDSQPLTIEMPAGEWLLTSRPAFSGDLLEAYEAGRRAAEDGDLAAGTAALLDLAEHSDEPETVAFLLARVEDLWFAEKLWPQQERLDQLAARPLLQPRPRLLAVLAARRAVRLEWQTRWDESGQADDEALRLLDLVAPDSLLSASVLFHRAPIHRDAGQLDAFRTMMVKAHGILASQAPDSLPLARAQSRMAFSGLVDAGPDGCITRIREALQLADGLAPDSLEAATIATSLAIRLRPTGALVEADALYQRALATRQRLAPGSMEHAASVLNVGNMRIWMGDQAAAAEFLSYALDLAQRHRLGPSLLSVIQSNQAGLLANEGHLEAARDLYRQSLSSAEAVEPRYVGIARALIDLARIEFALGDWPAARAAIDRRMALAAEGIAVPGWQEAFAHRLEGQMALARADHEAARRAFERALETDGRLAPGSAVEAEDLARLAQLAGRSGKIDEALRLYERALAGLEDQRSRTSADPTRSALFGAQHFDLYTAYIDALVSAGRPAEAFAVLERSRARALREQLTEREWARDGELSKELAAERREAEAQYARVRASLARLGSAAPQSESDALREQLLAQRLRLESVVEQVRRNDPRLAALQYPQPLDLDGVRAALDPGTLLLAYSVGEHESLLFVVQAAPARDGFAVHRLPIARAELRRRVDSFRSVVGFAARQPSLAEEVRGQASQLFDLLLRPAWDEARRARRVLIAPDDALTGLPFAALRRGGRYVAELKPTHTTTSATLYFQSRRAAERPARPDDVVAVFGDPLTAGPSAAPLTGSGILRSLGSLGPLPATRAEAHKIAALYPGARTYLGADASEPQARALPRNTRLAHFACHAFADPLSPMHSALVLSTSAQANDPDADGLLEAWEIMALRLDADLVTLSACQTALGASVAGEGPMGLTRAFLHAGARSVVSSLWKVADDSTQELMTRFYRELRAGRPKDEALRRAQAALLRGRWKAPFHWAGFQLQGDWR